MRTQQPELNESPHRRRNILTGEWVLVSPQRTKRPWQGEISGAADPGRRSYEPDCYLCPGNTRANGQVNPQYSSTFVFTNDFSALRENVAAIKENQRNLLVAEAEKGICRVVNFSPRHDATLAEMSRQEIENVVAVWQEEFKSLGSHRDINYVQIFENKGALMGNSNPHPHCQIWAQESIPVEPKKELTQFKRYYNRTKRSLLADYLGLERRLKERVVFENASMVVVVPFWAVWPYETMIITRRKMRNILELRKSEATDFADALKVLTSKYDNLFNTSFPYSAGLHQAPTDGKEHKEWHLHMHFYPPLLRSATVKKFMVGYEMLAEPQRDITAELSAKILRELAIVHGKSAKK